MNAIAFQENSGFGKSYNINAFTDAHDVVLVPLCLCNRGTHSSVVQPASNPRTDLGAQEAQPPCPVSTQTVAEEASASAAQPASNTGMDLDVEVTDPPSGSSSSTHPEEVEQTHLSEPSRALSLGIPTSSTPLYSTLLEKLANTDDVSIMDSLASMCLFGDLQNKPPAINAAQPDHDPTSPYDLSMRVECLLEKIKEQRELHIARIAKRKDPRLRHKDRLIFHDRDMREIMNAWRSQPETWMKSETLQKLKNYTTQQCHQTIKSAFSTMLFSLFGNKSFTETCIRYPVCSAEQPANILKEFAEAWQAGQNSIELQRERERSKPNPNKRLSKQIHELNQLSKHAAYIRRKIAEDWNYWYQLSWKDKKLWEEHDDADIRRQIAALRAQQQPRFAGAAPAIARNMTQQC